MSFYGDKIRISIFGESHGEAIGTVIEGLPAGFKIDMEKLGAFLKRRAPGGKYTTKRKEADEPKFISGLMDGVTTGAPLTALIYNTNTRSGDYAKLKEIPRPSHADYPAYVKFGGFNDIRGGGHFSARITAPLCIAGGILLQMLEEKGIHIGSHIYEIAGVPDEAFDPMLCDLEKLHAAAKKEFAVLDDDAGEKMKEKIASAALAGDSVGGIIECAIMGLPAGLGDTLFSGLEGMIAQAVFAIPAVKGLEFGAGFSAAKKMGSENNDPYAYVDGEVKTLSNNAGGILGGISTGMPIIFRAAFKPTPSIAKEQDSVNLATKENVKLAITGRHDPCVAVRAAAIVEAAAAAAIAGLVL